MVLRGIDFGPVLDASGVRGWFGEGYPFHRITRPNFEGSTFVSKTTTLAPRDPHGVLRRDGRTVRMLQSKVRVHWWKGIVFNGLSLPGPGLLSLLADGRWQQRTEPFFISVATVGKTPDDREIEAKRICDLLRAAKPDFKAPFGLQVNLSCPSGAREDWPPVNRQLGHYCALDVPLMLKFSASDPLYHVDGLTSSMKVDAFCVSNSLTYHPDLDMYALFDGKPPVYDVPMGMSGAPLLPLVADWIRRVRNYGIKKPINAGGGILRPSDVDLLCHAGASSVFIGSMAILRPWRVQPTIRRAETVFSKP